MFNLCLYIFQLGIEITQNGLCEIATRTLDILFAENGFDLVQIKSHLFETQDHTHPNQLVVAITSKTAFAAALGFDQSHFFVKTDGSRRRTRRFCQFPNVHHILI